MGLHITTAEKCAWTFKLPPSSVKKEHLVAVVGFGCKRNLFSLDLKPFLMTCTIIAVQMCTKSHEQLLDGGKYYELYLINI